MKRTMADKRKENDERKEERPEETWEISKEKKMSERESCRGYDRNNTNRKLVSTAEETTSLHLVTTFVFHSVVLLLYVPKVYNIFHSPASEETNQVKHNSDNFYWKFRVYIHNHKKFASRQGGEGTTGHADQVKITPCHDFKDVC